MQIHSGTKLVTALAASAAAVLSLSGPVLASASEPPVIQAGPTDTPRSEQARVPYLIGGRDADGQSADRIIVDGALRVPTPSGKLTELFGKRGTSYIVASDRHLYRVEADGTSRLLVKDARGSVVLSENGRRAAVAQRPKRTRPSAPVPVKVINTKNGDVVRKKSFPGYINVLAVDGRRVLASSYVGTGRNQRTFDWRYRTDEVETITRRFGTEVDVAGDRLAARKGRIDNGCVVVSELRKPSKILWRTCTGEQLDSFGPDGYMLTSGYVLDDEYQADALLRDRTGNLIARYDVPAIYGTFSNSPAVGAGIYSQWEAPGSVLIGAVTFSTTPATYSLLRCTPTSCEPAGATWTNQP